MILVGLIIRNVINAFSDFLDFSFILYFDCTRNSHFWFDFQCLEQQKGSKAFFTFHSNSTYTLCSVKYQTPFHKYYVNIFCMTSRQSACWSYSELVNTRKKWRSPLLLSCCKDIYYNPALKRYCTWVAYPC